MGDKEERRKRGGGALGKIASSFFSIAFLSDFFCFVSHATSLSLLLHLLHSPGSIDVLRALLEDGRDGLLVLVVVVGGGGGRRLGGGTIVAFLSSRSSRRLLLRQRSLARRCCRSSIVGDNRRRRWQHAGPRRRRRGRHKCAFEKSLEFFSLSLLSIALFLLLALREDFFDCESSVLSLSLFLSLPFFLSFFTLFFFCCFYPFLSRSAFANREVLGERVLEPSLCSRRKRDAAATAGFGAVEREKEMMSARSAMPSRPLLFFLLRPSPPSPPSLPRTIPTLGRRRCTHRRGALMLAIGARTEEARLHFQARTEMQKMKTSVFFSIS